ncbi:MAG: TetR/AcrR family transcriptional regulator [Myxococcota bacterium]
MSKRDDIVEAAHTLFWRHGFESTSPGMILKESGAGQGSLYHHFSGKVGLASEVLGESVTALTERLDATFDGSLPPLDRVVAWLHQPRDALAGCRLGRFAAEQDVLDQPELAAPLAAYFADVTDRIEAALTAAQREGTLPPHLHPGDLACTLVAVVQGGYVASRATGDRGAMEKALRGALSLLRSIR